MTAATPTLVELPRLERHLPALDGVRGMALLMVLLFHSTVMPIHSTFDDYFTRIIGGGWCGVDLFFVLSGFLITGILIDAKGSDRYFTSFYGRRLVRIFPLYYAFLVVAFFIVPATFDVDDHVRSQQVWYWLYLSNFLHAVDHSAMTLELSITWTLAVEEQFYLLWPAVVYLVSTRTLIRLCVAIIPLVLAARLGMRLAGVHAGVVYSMTFCRFDTLACGALVAALVRRPGGVASIARPAKAVVATGAAILGGIFIYEKKFGQYTWLMQSIGYSTLAIAFAALIVWVLSAPAAGRFGRFWRSPMLRLLGKHSYAMYLLHMPLKRELTWWVFGRRHIESWGLPPIVGQMLVYLLIIGATLLAAIVVWHLIEKPFLQLKRFFPYKTSASPQPSCPPLRT